MERGTDREREAVRERWLELERQRTRADRFVYGAALLGAGVLLLLLSVPGEACVHGGGVAGAACTAVEAPAVVEAVLVALGVAAVVGGVRLCRGALGDRGRPRLATLGLW